MLKLLSTRDVLYIHTLCGLICALVWFVKLYKHDFEVMKYVSYVMPTCAISGL